MKNITLPLLAAVLLLLPITSLYSQVHQEWVRQYLGRTAAMVVDGAGNVYVTGSVPGSGTSADYVTIKYRSSGDTVWMRRYHGPGSGSDGATAVAVDVAGNVYVTGSSTGSGTSLDYATIKYNSSGDSLWVRRYNGPGNGDDEAGAVAIDEVGNVYVAGTSTGSSTSTDFTTIKYSSSGDSLWVRRYDGPGHGPDKVVAMASDAAGNVCITGRSTDASGIYSDYATIKYNSSGDSLWLQRYDGPVRRFDNVSAMVVDGAGNVYVTGSSAVSSTSTDYATIKYNSSGIQQWLRLYHGPLPGNDGASAIAVDVAGNVHITGGSAGDYATIKYSSSGDTLWLRRHSGSANSSDNANTMTVDSAGNVYVSGSSEDENSISHCETIEYDASGEQQWVQRYDSSVGASSIAVDGSGNIYVAYHPWCVEVVWCFESMVCYMLSTSKLNVLIPAAGQRWISGTAEEIEWIGDASGLVDIAISVDDGKNFTSIAQTTNVGDNSFAYSMPYNQPSAAKCCIRVRDIADPSNFAISDRFLIKGYDLVKKGSDGNLIAFDPQLHSWPVSNSDVPRLWPSTSWPDYFHDIDPYTGARYTSPFYLPPNEPQNSDYTDWWSFVEAFGEDDCYWFTGGARAHAIARWKAASGPFNGACYGMCVGTLQSFLYEAAFFSKWQRIPRTATIGSLATNPAVMTPVREALAILQNYQRGVVGKENIGVNLSTTPRDVLLELESAFLSEEIDECFLIFRNVLGGHAVVPYGIERAAGNEDIYEVLVYDPNRPLIGRRIRIDVGANTYEAFVGDVQYSGNKDFFLSPSVGLFLAQQTLPSIAAPVFVNPLSLAGSSPSSQMEFSTRAKSDLTIRSSGEDSIGCINGAAFSTIDSGIPIVPFTGNPQRPVGYLVPAGVYAARLSHFRDSISSFSSFSDSEIFTYGRSDADSTQTDLITYDGGLGIRNPDNRSKLSNFQVIRTEPNAEKTFTLLDASMRANDSMRVDLHQEDRLRVLNAGSGKTYALRLRHLSSSGEVEFLHRDVPLDSNAVHIINARWDSLADHLVEVYVDLGNDGTIDDTLLLRDVLSSVREVEFSSASEHAPAVILDQNYPNPFNPSTTISYSLSQTSPVVLRVYNGVGGEVATLVDEVQSAGRHAIVFESRGLADGIYTCQLVAGTRVQTRTMVLVKQ